MMRKSPMRRGTSQLKHSLFKRSNKPGAGKGLAQRIAESLERAIKHANGESSLLRSKQHRRNVAALACAVCDRHGPSQCAHINFSKGLALKACDSLTFPACPDCHRNHDSGGMPRQERWRREWEYVDKTRAQLISKNKWDAATEAAYQKAIVPLARVVHPEQKECPASAAADPGVAHTEMEY